MIEKLEESSQPRPMEEEIVIINAERQKIETSAYQRKENESLQAISPPSEEFLS